MSTEPLLFDTLSQPERAALATLSHHPGYDVLVRMMQESCKRITERLAKLDPLAQDYSEKLPLLHLQCRTVNEFCSSVLKSVEFQARIAVIQQSMSEDEVRKLLDEVQNQIKGGNPLGQAIKLKQENSDE